jgi:hypothetical protein
MNFDLRQILSIDLRQVLSPSAREGEVFSRQWFSSQRSHRYQAAAMGHEFVIEPFVDEPGCYVMTSQKAGVKAGDLVVIDGDHQIQNYRVVEIDYYCGELSDMWIAKLVPVGADM